MSFFRVPLKPIISFKIKDTWNIYIGVQWFEGHFLKQCAIAQPQLLMLAPHSSQESLNLLTLAKANDIQLLALPPHTTHWMNPLDKTSFGSFQKEYNTVCTEFMSKSPKKMVSKWERPKLFRLAHDKAFSLRKRCQKVPVM